MKNILITVPLLVLSLSCLTCFAEEPSDSASVSSSSMGTYSLETFGPVSTAAEAEATLQKATDAVIGKGGGILVIPPGVAADWTAINRAPSSTKADTPTVTLVDRRNGVEKILPPSNGDRVGGVWAGRLLRRDVRQPIPMTYGTHSTQAIETNIAGGTSSYSQPILEEVKAGKDVRIYVTTIRGLAVNNYVAVSDQVLGYGSGKGADRGPIKALGWDKEKRLPYVVMDLEKDHPKQALLNDKHVVNSLTLRDHSQSDNQSMGLMVGRYNYGQGDSFVISARSITQGNVMSAAGDEGGLTYASDISNDLRPFRSKVESVDWSKGELVYEPGLVQNHTLGTSRPLINMNPKKHLNKGTVAIFPPAHEDPWAALAGPDQKLDPYVGGAIIGDKDCGWTQDVVGRFFAVDEPTEYLDPANDPNAGYTSAPDMRVYRWYLIQGLEDLPDGRKRLYVERTRWWSRNRVVPVLYRTENYSAKDQEKPLHYIIAPGAYVADVSKSWTPAMHSGGTASASDSRTLILAPSPDIGTSFDFEKGDPVVQAIGADPWNVTGMRVRHFNYVPTTIEDASYAAKNLGRVMVNSGLSLSGGNGNLADDEQKSKDGNPRYQYGVRIEASTKVGMLFKGDVQEAAIRFEQRNNRAQPIVWRTSANHSDSSLEVDPQSGAFLFRGGAGHFSGLVLGAQGGLSGSDKPAANLRGIGVAVQESATEWTVDYPRGEADATYALWIQPSWLTATAVTQKTAKGFTVQFEKPAPKGAKLDWILVR